VLLLGRLNWKLARQLSPLILNGSLVWLPVPSIVVTGSQLTFWACAAEPDNDRTPPPKAQTSRPSAREAAASATTLTAPEDGALRTTVLSPDRDR
jgi:hypothetical protein